MYGSSKVAVLEDKERSEIQVLHQDMAWNRF